MLAYRKTIDCYSATSLNSFLNSLFSELNLSVSMDSLGCLLARQTNQLQIMMTFVSFPIVILHFFFPSYCVSYRPANICLAWGKSTNGGPLTTCQETMNWNTNRRKKANACCYWDTIIVMEESIVIERGRTWHVDLSFLLLSTSAAQVLPEHQSICLIATAEVTNLCGIQMHLPFVSSTHGKQYEVFPWHLNDVNYETRGLGLCVVPTLSTGYWMSQVPMSLLINVFLCICNTRDPLNYAQVWWWCWLLRTLLSTFKD